MKLFEDSKEKLYKFVTKVQGSSKLYNVEVTANNLEDAQVQAIRKTRKIVGNKDAILSTVNLVNEDKEIKTEDNKSTIEYIQFERSDENDLIGSNYYNRENLSKEDFNKLIAEGDYKPVDLKKYKEYFKEHDPFAADLENEDYYEDLKDTNTEMYSTAQQYLSPAVYNNDKFIIIVIQDLPSSEEVIKLLKESVKKELGEFQNEGIEGAQQSSDQTIIEINNESTEKPKIGKDDKVSFEEFKELYKGYIDTKYKQDYPSLDIDNKLWEDIAKELYISAKDYVLTESNNSSNLNIKKEGLEIVDQEPDDLDYSVGYFDAVLMLDGKKYVVGQDGYGWTVIRNEQVQYLTQNGWRNFERMPREAHIQIPEFGTDDKGQAEWEDYIEKLIKGEQKPIVMESKLKKEDELLTYPKVQEILRKANNENSDAVNSLINKYSKSSNSKSNAPRAMYLGLTTNDRQAFVRDLKRILNIKDEKKELKEEAVINEDYIESDGIDETEITDAGYWYIRDLVAKKLNEIYRDVAKKARTGMKGVIHPRVITKEIYDQLDEEAKKRLSGKKEEGMKLFESNSESWKKYIDMAWNELFIEQELDSMDFNREFEEIYNNLEKQGIVEKAYYKEIKEYAEKIFNDCLDKQINGEYDELNEAKEDDKITEITNKIIEEFELIMEDEELDSIDFDDRFDEVFDQLYPGCNISAKEYVDLRKDCKERFKKLMLNESNTISDLEIFYLDTGRFPNAGEENYFDGGGEPINNWRVLNNRIDKKVVWDSTKNTYDEYIDNVIEE